MKDSPPADSFAAMFEQQARQTPQRRDVKVGQRLEVVVVQIGRDAVFVELDGKRQAYLDTAELLGPDGVIAVKVGDTIAAHVVEVDERIGQVRLARSMGKANNVGALEQAKAASIPVEGKVTAVNKGGLEVDFSGTRAFCPMSQIDSNFTEDPQAFVGRTLRFLVKEIREGGKSVVVSRRGLLEREARDAQAGLKDLGTTGTKEEEPKPQGPAITPGSVHIAVVDRIETYGVFAQIAGTKGREGRGLIPAGELGVPRGTDLRKAFPEGTKVTVTVMETTDGRIRLSVKGAKEAEERAQFTEARDKVAAPVTLGTFGDLLKKSRK